VPKKGACRSRTAAARPTGAVPILGHVEKRAWGGRLAWSTAIFSLATGLSRILGLIREIVAAYFFGTRGAINAFTVAFQIPNLIRAIVADAALSSAFVPIFTELHEKGERERAWRVASSLIWLLLLGLSALTALFVLLAPLIIPLFGLPATQEDLAVRLSQILFPIIVLLGISGIVVGILNSYEHFTVPALTPVFWNLAIIGGLLIGVPRASSESAELYVYAGSILVGTVIQLLLPLPWLAGRDGRLRAVIDWRDPAVRRVFALMLPVSLGLGLINFNALIGVFFASRYIDPNIAPTAIDKAFRIYMLPQGMFSVAVATVLFPRLARLAARADMDEFRHTVSLGLRQIGFLLIPASVVIAVLAHPIVRLLYERGDFEPDQTPVVANALAAFSLGLVFNGAMLMMNRAFFSLQAPWTPTVLALGNLALNTVLNFALYRVGTWGIPLATSIANIVGTVLLLFVLRRRLGRIEFGETASSGIRVLLASAPLAAISYVVWRVLDEALGRSFGDQLVSLGTALLVGVAVYLISSRLLRVRELEALLTLRSAFRRA
jgi:putative peptidoglycan lipid II flippase